MGDFGEIHLGHDDNAYGRFQVGAPTHEGSFGADDAIQGAQLIDNASNASASSRIGTGLVDSSAGNGEAYNDNAKIVYVSPSFNGFKFGASTRDSDSHADNPTSFGASYSGDVGPGSLTVKAATETNNADGNGKKASTHYGVSYGMGAFTVTVSRYKGDGDGKENKDLEVEATEFGVGFKVSDQLEIGAARTSSEAKNVDIKYTETGTGHGQAGGPMTDVEGTFTSVSGSYTIAPGLKTTLALNQFDVEDQNFAGSKNDGSEIVWQVEMAF